MQTTSGIGRSDVGRTRTRNEDSFVVDDELGLYVVSDGMGGHAAGEVASALAVEAVRDVVSKQRATVAEVIAGSAHRRELARIVEEAVLEACRRVHERATSPEGQAGMGCTVTVLLCADRFGAMGHAGDSRLYLIRGAGVNQLSNDHTVAAEMARSGLIAPDKISDNPFAHVLSRAVGTQPVVNVDTLVFDLLPDDQLLLCSDGYSNYLPDPMTLRAMVEGDAEAVGDALVAMANEAGGEDNITVVLVGVHSEEPQLDRVTRIEDRYDALGSVFLFEHLELPLLMRVMAACVVEAHGAGDVVIEHEQRTEDMIVVVDGAYELVSDGEIVGELGPSDHVGATTMFRPRKARATMRAAKPSRVLRLTPKRFSRLVRERPWLGIGLLERLGRRLSSDLDRSFLQREGSGEPSDPREKF